MGYLTISAQLTSGTSKTVTTQGSYPHGINGIVGGISVTFTGAPNTTTVTLQAINDIASTVTLLDLSAGNTSAVYHPTYPAHTTAGAVVDAKVRMPIYIECEYLSLVIANADSDTGVVVKIQFV